MSQAPHALLADIGGTHARFALAEDMEPESGAFTVGSERKYKRRDSDGLEAAIRRYLAEVGDPVIRWASIAVAGPVGGDRVDMTNTPWTFSIGALTRELGVDRVEVINDAAAGALASLRLRNDDLDTVRAGMVDASAPRVHVIPGTGLGVSAILKTGAHWVPVAGEGGHIGLAPTTPEQFAALGVIARDLGRVTAEDVLSGPGMLRLYRALAQVRGVPPEDLSHIEVSRHADEDPLCSDTVDSYCALLGSLCGDFALIYGAHGGVWLTGNVLQTMGMSRISRQFVPAFEDKGKMSRHLSNVPVFLARPRGLGLLGAGVWLMERLTGASGVTGLDYSREVGVRDADPALLPAGGARRRGGSQ